MKTANLDYNSSLIDLILVNTGYRANDAFWLDIGYNVEINLATFLKIIDNSVCLWKFNENQF